MCHFARAERHARFAFLLRAFGLVDGRKPSIETLCDGQKPSVETQSARVFRRALRFYWRLSAVDEASPKPSAETQSARVFRRAQSDTWLPENDWFTIGISPPLLNVRFPARLPPPSMLIFHEKFFCILRAMWSVDMPESAVKIMIIGQSTHCKMKKLRTHPETKTFLNS